MSAALARGAPAVLILRQIARELQRATGADTVAIYQLDPHARALVPIAAYHVPKDIPESRRQSLLALSHSPALRCSVLLNVSRAKGLEL